MNKQIKRALLYMVPPTVISIMMIMIGLEDFTSAVWAFGYGYLANKTTYREYNGFDS